MDIDFNLSHSKHSHGQLKMSSLKLEIGQKLTLRQKMKRHVCFIILKAETDEIQRIIAFYSRKQNWFKFF